MKVKLLDHVEEKLNLLSPLVKSHVEFLYVILPTFAVYEAINSYPDDHRESCSLENDIYFLILVISISTELEQKESFTTCLAQVLDINQ